MAIAFVTSIGESTTNLCEWSLERLGFEVVLIKNQLPLYEKLRTIYSMADDDFIRVDADVVVNKNILELVKQTELLWYQAYTFDWFKQDYTHGGVQFIRKEAIRTLRENIHHAKYKERPESFMFRLKEFHEPRVCGTFETICGLHGYKQRDTERIKATKERREQAGYDWELADMIEQL